MTNEELAVAIKSGNDGLMDQLWQQCYGYIRQQAIRWDNAWKERPDFDVEDLTQSGYIALCKAVRNFQADRGGFITVLAYCLKTEFSKIARCRTKAQQKEPLNNAISLNSPAYDDPDSDATIEETIPVEDPGFNAVEKDIFNQQLAVVLRNAMDELPEKHRRTIELYYLHGMTQSEIAETLHCASSYPGQLIKDALKRMRSGECAPTLSEMLYGERNFYRCTGISAFKRLGCGSPEWEVLHKESRLYQYNIDYCVDALGMSLEQAQRICG